MKIVMPMVLRPNLSPAAAAVACSHGALAGYLRWKDEPIVQQWIASVFYKRIYQARDLDMWQAIQKWPDSLVLTESALDHLAVIAVFMPRAWTPSNPFTGIPLYSA